MKSMSGGKGHDSEKRRGDEFWGVGEGGSQEKKLKYEGKPSWMFGSSRWGEEAEFRSRVGLGKE